MDPKQIKPGMMVRRRSPRSVAKARIASALCLIPGIYCIGIVAFALRNAPDYATALPQFLRYIAAPGLLAILFALVAVKGSRVLRVNLGGAACIVLVVLFVNETRLEAQYLSAVSDLFTTPVVDASEKVARVHGLPPGRTVKSLNQSLGTARLQDAVVGGLPKSQVDLCTLNNRAITYQADRYGFRNPEAAYARPTDLLVVGDSFVEGICLLEGEDLMGRLRATRQDVVGLGIRGAGPLMNLAILGRYGAALRPNWTVVVFYEGNDWEDLERELSVPWLREGLENNAVFGPTSLSSELIGRAEAQVDRWAAESAPDSKDLLRKTHTLRNFLALHQTWTQVGLGYPKVARRIPQFDQALARMRRIVGSWRGRLALAYIPQTSRFVGALPDQFVYDQLRKQVLASAMAQGIPIIDLTPGMSRQTRPIDLYRDGHFNAKGARFAAEAIVAELDRLNLQAGER